jgi:hypothetical protein
MVSFGAAPALVMYEWALRDSGRLGWIAAFVYCAGAALRLARFNTQLAVADKRWFTGLPSPAAAALVAGMIWVLNDYQVRGFDVKWYRRGAHGVRGHHHDLEREVLQRQGHQPAPRRAVLGRDRDPARAAADLDRAVARALGHRAGLRVSGYVGWVVQRWRTEATRRSTRTSATRSRKANHRARAHARRRRRRIP